MLHRKERAESYIQQELTLLLRDHVRDPRVSALTVTEVELTQDRRFARVFVASYEDDDVIEAAMEGLESAKGLLRRELAQRLRWRFTPQIEFRLDRSWQYGERMDRLFDEIAQERDAEEPAEPDGSE
jgi:ribosome-binding factor A